MKKKLVSVLLCAMMVVGMVSGCGKNSSEADSGKTNEGTESEGTESKGTES